MKSKIDGPVVLDEYEVAQVVHIVQEHWKELEQEMNEGRIKLISVLMQTEGTIALLGLDYQLGSEPLQFTGGAELWHSAGRESKVQKAVLSEILKSVKKISAEASERYAELVGFGDKFKTKVILERPVE